MEIYRTENVSFAYPTCKNKALCDVTLTIQAGEFITLCGKSGCGKTTLLRLLKSSLAPHGELQGRILFEDKTLAKLDAREQAAKIGFVMQNPDNQIVTDTVWHELAFGLESLGCQTPEIRARVSEMASFFGIESWFYKKVSELSGGQKQLLNLASVMVMQPSVLILDEPTSQLDPIAAGDFFKTLEKINRELGTTVILSEHRLEDAIPISNRVIVLDGGKVIADDSPEQVAELLKKCNHDMLLALPTPMRVYNSVENDLKCPLTVRDGRLWLEEYAKNHTISRTLANHHSPKSKEPIIEIKDAYFRYEKKSPDVIKGLNLTVQKGEIFAILGGNGTGKTTALSLISGLHAPHRGQVLINKKEISEIRNPYQGMLGVLPQNPQSLFVKKTVYLDLLEMLSEQKLSREEKHERIYKMASLCAITELLDKHPYDISGGEQQRAALCKVLLTSPKILLLDEPTKGMDAHFKLIFANILNDLTASGVTVVMVSHDIEFCAEFANRCVLFFDGNITSEGMPREFFAGKSFYTTAANRMARTIFPDAVLCDDIILSCGGNIPKREKQNPPKIDFENSKKDAEEKKNKAKQLTPARIITGLAFALLFLLTEISITSGYDILHLSDIKVLNATTLQIITLIEIAISAFCFLPQKEIGIAVIQMPKSDRKLTKRTLTALLIILFAIPLTIYIGIHFLGDRKYYCISLLIIFETLIPFVMLFESRKPKSRELVIISVLCAIAVAGRSAFFMLPQCKPVIALVIISGVCFGGETGFLVGAMTGFVSNFFFGQGPWTPWQMFAFGIIGFIAGILFRKGFLRKTKASLSIYGFIAVLVIFGGIMNPASVIMSQAHPTKNMIIAAYLAGLPADLVHALSTIFFLWFLSEPLIDKLERVKIKYGLIEE